MASGAFIITFLSRPIAFLNKLHQICILVSFTSLGIDHRRHVTALTLLVVAVLLQLRLKNWLSLLLNLVYLWLLLAQELIDPFLMLFQISLFLIGFVFWKRLIDHILAKSWGFGHRFLLVCQPLSRPELHRLLLWNQLRLKRSFSLKIFLTFQLILHCQLPPSLFGLRNLDLVLILKLIEINLGLITRLHLFLPDDLLIFIIVLHPLSQLL